MGCEMTLYSTLLEMPVYIAEGRITILKKKMIVPRRTIIYCKLHSLVNTAPCWKIKLDLCSMTHHIPSCSKARPEQSTIIQLIFKVLPFFCVLPIAPDPIWGFYCWNDQSGWKIPACLYIGKFTVPSDLVSPLSTLVFHKITSLLLFLFLNNCLLTRYHWQE